VTATDIEATVHEWIAEHTTHAGALSTSSRLVAEGWLDSMQIVHLVEFLEKRFTVAIDLDEMVPENFDTVPQVAGMVERSLSRQQT